MPQEQAGNSKEGEVGVPPQGTSFASPPRGHSRMQTSCQVWGFFKRS